MLQKEAETMIDDLFCDPQKIIIIIVFIIIVLLLLLFFKSKFQLYF